MALLRFIEEWVWLRLPCGDLPEASWDLSIRHPHRAHARFARYFSELPREVIAHRVYFEKEGRGHGRRSFHSMWYLLYQRFQPRNFLEIGVFRGQVLSLVALLQKESGCPPDVTGISPLENVGDSVSEYPDLDYAKDIGDNFEAFGLGAPRLIKALSTEPAAIEAIHSRPWDCIYIDGGHDHDVVESDWEHCSSAVKPGGIVVFDDAGIFTRYRSFGRVYTGHPGPSEVVRDVVMKRSDFRLILQVGHNLVFQRES